MTKPAEKVSNGPLNYYGAAASLAQSPAHKSNIDASKSKPVIIKKYANRRLYNTETSSYVTLEDLGEMVRAERDFLVYDAKSGEDLTHSVLTQIIVEQEGRTGSNLLPINFLRQLIRFYGHSIEQLVPKYLEYSMETLTREQENYRKQFSETFGTAAFEAMQEQARQNMALFERAFSMFAPFAKAEGSHEGGEKTHAAGSGLPDQTSLSSATTVQPELSELKAQLASVQAQLDRLSKPAGGESS